jgi:hypothetical protein
MHATILVVIASKAGVTLNILPVAACGCHCFLLAAAVV